MSTIALLDRIRHDWQVREPDMATAPMLTFITLARAQSLLGDAVRSTAARADLTSATRDLLFTLYRSAPPEGLSASEIAALLAVSPATVTGSTDRLEARGLLTRTLDPDDRRSWRIALTDAGRALVRSHLPEHLAFEQSLLAALTPDEITQLETLLRRLIDHAETNGLV
ncbi:MarR family winged helix-turn-helix transcriptional regulator [uncultured Deinococcus sp.]|uniref:MarR family winged helix-turn-helix transcriptional regulator n=1 Tax=uncultured Deinococcus sp. TaxID=158789 RepID=UPI0025E36EDA|nr:MarR family transcriptional regulator [uncultured Deinococcus sp.]